MGSTTTGADTAAIAVSVVVPTCGRLALLGRCLDALTGQTLPGQHYEIIIVDDEPNHNTLHLVAGWRARTRGLGPRLVYVSNAGPHGPAAARNRGWQIALASVIAFTDDDTVPAPAWLASGLAAFAAGADAVCGHVDMPLPAIGADGARLHGQAEFVTANCFCRKQVLQRLDGFDERFTAPGREGSDLYFRLLDIGATIAHAPRALVVRPVRPATWSASLGQLKKTAFDALLYKKHPRLYREKIQAAPRWDHYAVVAALLLGGAAGFAGEAQLAIVAGIAWLVLTARLCARRLSGIRAGPAQVAGLILTSALVPPLAVFWRLAGAIRFRVRFA